MSKHSAPFYNFAKIVVTLLILSLGAADATLRPMESLAWSFGAATTVAVLRIDDIQIVHSGNDQCGVLYTATVLKSFKGETASENKQIHFGRFPGLEMDKTYLAFLEYENDPEVVYDKLKELNNLPAIKDEVEKKKVIAKVICNGLVPGLVVNFRFTWPIVINYVIMTGLLPADMPAEVRVYSTDSSQWWIQKQDLFSYLYRLAAEKN